MSRKFRFTQAGVTKTLMIVAENEFSTGARQVEFTDEEVGSLRLVIYASGKCVFYARVNFCNRRHNIRLGQFPALSVSAARKLVLQIQVWIYEGKNPKIELKRGAMHFSLMAEEYLKHSLRTKRSYAADESKLRLYMLPKFGRSHGDHITEQVIRDYHLEIAEALSKSTADKHLFLLRSIFGYHVEQGNLVHNPTTGVKPFRAKTGEARYLTEAELTAFIAACHVYQNPEIGALLLLLLFTGMRVGEALPLTFTDYDATNKCIRLGLTKNGKPFVVPLNDFADQIMQQQQQKHGSGYVFPGSRGGHISRPHRAFKSCIEMAGIRGEGLKIHSLRHSFASHMLMSGASLIEVSRLLNHSSVSVTEIYSHLSDRSLRDASQRISDLFYMADNAAKPINAINTEESHEQD